MKNIHLIPTDKPSRLVKIKDNLFYTTTKNIPSGVYQNIYITSDEEKFIKYEYVTDGIEVIKATPKLVNAQGLVDRRDWKKIILTTDPKLFNDGVQFIDDEFLEWFVKNPNCEEVETIYGLFNPIERQVDPMNLGQNHSECVWKYKIIISNKEPDCNNCEWDYDMCPNAEECFKHTPKQHIEFVNENIDEFDEKIIKFKEKQKEILIEMMRDDEEAGLYDDFERRYVETNPERLRFPELVKEFPWYYKGIPIVRRMYSEEDLKRAHWNGWVQRERLDDMVPELDYPPGLDYEEKEEYAFNEFLKQLNNE